MFNVIWWHFTSGNIFHGSMSLDQLYLARPTPTLARWSGVDDDADDGKVYWGNPFPAHTRPFLVFYSADQVRTPSHLFSLHDHDHDHDQVRTPSQSPSHLFSLHDYYFAQEPTPAEEWWELPVELLPKPRLGKSSTKNGLSNKLLNGLRKNWRKNVQMKQVFGPTTHLKPLSFSQALKAPSHLSQWSHLFVCNVCTEKHELEWSQGIKILKVLFVSFCMMSLAMHHHNVTSRLCVVW